MTQQAFKLLQESVQRGRSADIRARRYEGIVEDNFLIRSHFDDPRDWDREAIRKVVAPEAILEARKVVRQLLTDDKVRDYIVDLVRATREPSAFGAADRCGTWSTRDCSF